MSVRGGTSYHVIQSIYVPEEYNGSDHNLRTRVLNTHRESLFQSGYGTGGFTTLVSVVGDEGQFLRLLLGALYRSWTYFNHRYSYLYFPLIFYDKSLS